MQTVISDQHDDEYKFKTTLTLMYVLPHTGCLATGADRVQRDHGGGPMGMPDTQDCVADPERLHKRGRRRGRCGSSDAARPERVHAAGVSRHRRRPRLLLVQTVEQLVRAQAAVVLGAHQPRHCKYR